MGSSITSYVRNGISTGQGDLKYSQGDSTCVDGIPNLTGVPDLINWCKVSRSTNTTLSMRNFVELHSMENFEEAMSFRIMQWNILADALGSGKDNFIKCPLKALRWETRKFLILEEMLTYSPDIICCQEVDHYHDFFHPQLQKAGYVGSFTPKPWSPCLDVPQNNGPDGCAIFFKSDKFELLDTKSISLKTMAFCRNHVALFQLLKVKNSDKNVENASNAFLIGTTHLKAKAGYESQRETQGYEILRFLESYISSETPVFLCGDFNAKPEEPVYSLIRKFKSNYFESVYAQLSSDKIEPPYTTLCIRPAGKNVKTVDYMFYSKTGFKIQRILELLSEEVIGSNGLPSQNYPSDHLSLVCDVQLSSTSSEAKKLSPKI